MGSIKERRCEQLNEREHILKKTMWAGSKEMQKRTIFIIEEGKFVSKEVSYIPALYKIFDEILVNALDHWNHYPKLVTRIEVDIEEDGSISVKNNGPGMPVKRHETGKWIPEMLASEFRTGDNLTTEENIKGGTNGYGLKIANIFSDLFELEIRNKGKKYIQSFENNMEIVNKAIVYDEEGKDYTKVTFIPSYLKSFSINYNEIKNTWELLLLSRVYHSAAVTDAKLIFNKINIELNWEEYCKLFINEVYTFKLTNSSGYIWKIGVGLSNGSFQFNSIINGVVVFDGGSNVNFIKKQIYEGIKPLLQKELSKSCSEIKPAKLYNNLFIILSCVIPNPQFDSQTKDKCSDNEKKYSEYKLSELHIKKIWEIIREKVISEFINSVLESKKQKSCKNDVDVPVYEGAELCTTKDKLKCTLIITEGNSTMGTINKGLTNDKASPKTFNKKLYGTFSSQGVVINSEKESILIKEPNSKKFIKINDHIIPKLDNKRVPASALIKNKRINDLITVLNLNYSYSYDYSEEGEKQYKTLRYGQVLCIMDQDLDGFNIFGLICTFFMTYWPYLFTRDYFRRLSTPVVRVYKDKDSKSSGLIKSFYNISEAESWLENNNKRGYDVVYFKGLGSHDQARGEITEMFKDIDNKIKIIVHDKEASKTKEAYYGKLTSKRKILLATPTDKLLNVSKRISVTEYFNTDIKAAQKYNNTRKLLSLEDGLNLCRRKILHTADKKCRSTKKVAGLAGLVVEFDDYPHGEDGLCESVTKMGQGYYLAKYLPFLVPIGNFGTFSKGYKDASSSRYIHTKLHDLLFDAIFIEDDNPILTYNISEGKRVEPVCYAPIVPLVLLENYCIPGTGWKCSILARDIHQVINRIKSYIKGERPDEKLIHWKHKYNGDIIEDGLKLTSIGKYELKGNICRITALPYETWSRTYCFGPEKTGSRESNKKLDEKGEKGIKTLNGIKRVVDRTNDTTYETNIEVEFYEDNNLKSIIESNRKNSNIDGIQDYLKLYKTQVAAINVININDEIVEYKSYEELFDDWYVYRKKMYKARINRQIIIYSLMLVYYENIQKFSDNHKQYSIDKNNDEEEVCNKLLENKFVKINENKLKSNSSEIQTSQLHDEILNSSDASFKYLLNLTMSDLCKKKYEAREKKIAELNEKLEDLKIKTPFKGAHIWIRELEKLELIINKMEETGEWFPSDE